MWQCSMVRTNLPGGVLGGTFNAVKSKGLLGQWIYMRMSWLSHLYSAVCYSLGYHPATFLDCHWIYICIYVTGCTGTLDELVGFSH